MKNKWNPTPQNKGIASFLLWRYPYRVASHTSGASYKRCFMANPSFFRPRWIIRTMVSWKRFVEKHGGKQETFTGKLETFPLFLETNLLFLETFPVQNFNYWKRFHFSWKRNHFSWKPNHRYWKRFQQSGNVSSKSGNVSTKFGGNVETFPPNFWWKRFLETDIEIVQQSIRDIF